MGDAAWDGRIGRAEYHSTSEPILRLAPPEHATVAGYQVLFELGRGGMGSAWLAVAHDGQSFERQVVIKRLREELATDPEAEGRFIDEARNAALVRHDNVVSIHQTGRDAQGPFLVLDYIEGATLEQLLDWHKITRQKLPIGIVCRIALDIARGLSAIHTARDARGRPMGILHRDITLQNLLINTDGVAKIADFGIARSAQRSVATDRNYLVGKIMYLPPEYLQREPCDFTLDVYSFGINLWMALADRRPWQVNSEAQLLWVVCEEGVPPLAEVAPHIPKPLAEFVDRACSKRKEQRQASGVELYQELLAITRDLNCIGSQDDVAEAVMLALGSTLERRRDRIATELEAAELQTLEASRTSIQPVSQARLLADPSDDFPPKKLLEPPASAPSQLSIKPQSEQSAKPPSTSRLITASLMVLTGTALALPLLFWLWWRAAPPELPPAPINRAQAGQTKSAQLHWATQRSEALAEPDQPKHPGRNIPHANQSPSSAAAPSRSHQTAPSATGASSEIHTSNPYRKLNR